MTPTSSLVYSHLGDLVDISYEIYENNVLIDSGISHLQSYMIGTGSYSTINSIRNANPSSNERIPSAFDNTWQGGAVNIPAIHIDEQYGLGVVMAVAPCAFYGLNDITSVTFETLTNYDYEREWEEDGNSYKEITHFSGTIGVTTIGARAFQTPTSPVENTMTSVTLPSTLTFLGMYNFARRTALETINLQDCTGLGFNSSSNYTGAGICLGCTSLTEITIPAQITYLGSQFCTDCTGLTSIKVLATNPPELNTSTTANTPFYNSTCPIYVPEASVSSYKSSWSIYSSRIQAIPAFQPYMSVGNIPIEKIDIFSSLGDVGIKVYVGDGDEGILVYSRAKPTVGTPELVYTYSSTDNGYIVGDYFTSLSAITSDTSGSHGTDGGGLDSNWTGGDVIIPESYDDGTHGELPVIGIGCNAFFGINNITSVSIPYTVLVIGAFAFGASYQNADTTMTSFTIDTATSLYFIGGNALQYRQGLTTLTIPPSVTSLGLSFAINCTGLTRVDLYLTSSSVKVTSRSQAYCWFWGCSSNCVVYIRTIVSNPTSTFGSYWRFYSSGGQLSYTADLTV